MGENKILSFSRDRESLMERESTLRKHGFEVVSVSSDVEARFEIEMGRCGIFLICFRTNPETTQELADLFKLNCPKGHIIFVMNEKRDRAPRGADYAVPEAAGPEAIVRVLRVLGRLAA
jgi:hypothetical protein